MGMIHLNNVKPGKQNQYVAAENNQITSHVCMYMSGSKRFKATKCCSFDICVG